MGVYHELVLFLAIALVAAAGAVSDEFLPAGVWPSARRTASNTGWSPVNASFGAGSTGASAVLWTYQTGKAVSATPVIGPDGRVMVGSVDGTFYCLDGRTGALKWTFTAGDTISSSAAVAPDMRSVVFGSANGYVYSLDAFTGAEKWRFAAHHASHLRNDSTIVNPDRTAAIGQCTRDWVGFGIAGPQPGPSNAISSHITFGANNTVFVGSNNYRMYSLDATTGTENYALFVGPYLPFGAVWGAPLIRESDNSSVVFTGMDGGVYSITHAGTCQWRLSMWTPISASPAHDTNRSVVYAGTWDHQLLAINDATGAINWKFAARFHIYSAAAISPVSGLVYFGSSDGSFYALYPNGTLCWQFDTPLPIRSDPALSADGVVFFGGNDGILYALNATSGERLWSYDTGLVDRQSRVGGGVELNGGVALSETSVLFGTHDGRVISIPFHHCYTTRNDPRCSFRPTHDWSGARHADATASEAESAAAAATVAAANRTAAAVTTATLLYLTPDGRTSRVMNDSLIQRSASFSFRVIVTHGVAGHARRVNSCVIRSTSLNATSMILSPSPASVFPYTAIIPTTASEFMLVATEPGLMLQSNWAYTLTIGLEYTFRHVNSTEASGGLTQTFRFRTVADPVDAAPINIDPSPSRVAVTHFHSLSPWQPAFGSSIGYAAFDRFDILSSVIHVSSRHPHRFVMFAVAARPIDGGAAIRPGTGSTHLTVDPFTESITAFDGVRDGNSVLLTSAHLRLIAGGGYPIEIDGWRLASQLQNGGVEFGDGTSLYMKLWCLRTWPGAWIWFSGLCDKVSHFNTIASIRASKYGVDSASVSAGNSDSDSGAGVTSAVAASNFTDLSRRPAIADSITLQSLYQESVLVFYHRVVVLLHMDTPQAEEWARDATNTTTAAAQSSRRGCLVSLIPIDEDTGLVIPIKYRDATTRSYDAVSKVLTVGVDLPIATIVEPNRHRVLVLFDLFPVISHLYTGTYEAPTPPPPAPATAAVTAAEAVPPAPAATVEAAAVPLASSTRKDEL